MIKGESAALAVCLVIRVMFCDARVCGTTTSATTSGADLPRGPCGPAAPGLQKERGASAAVYLIFWGARASPEDVLDRGTKSCSGASMRKCRCETATRFEEWKVSSSTTGR